MASVRWYLLLTAMLLTSSAMAWGPQGHRMVGLLAEHQLSPTARAEVQRLLFGEQEPSLAGIANWADTLRGSELGKKTASWHYINFPREDCSYVPARDCPDGNCVIAAINRNFLLLADHRRPDSERRDALKFLVHFVGDSHQPLHAGYQDDRGANRFQINYQGKNSNLHSVWDSLILRSRALEANDYAQLLNQQSPLPEDKTRASDRPAVAWALESCRVVQQGDLYPDSHIIDDDYLKAHRALVEQRLRQAGNRLADMINYALANTSGTK